MKQEETPVFSKYLNSRKHFHPTVEAVGGRTSPVLVTVLWLIFRTVRTTAAGYGRYSALPNGGVMAGGVSCAASIMVVFGWDCKEGFTSHKVCKEYSLDKIAASISLHENAVL